MAYEEYNNMQTIWAGMDQRMQDKVARLETELDEAKRQLQTFRDMILYLNEGVKR